MAIKAQTTQATTAPTVVARETSALAPSAETSLQIQIAPASAPRVELAAEGVQVWMPQERAAGIRAFGDLLPGTVYAVAPGEALRLVTAKGFRFASAADQVRISDHIDGIADAASTPKE